MALTQLAPPYPIFTDKSGDPLDNGYLYFGEVNKNPETNPIQVYYDSAFTQPAAQPLRTSNGYVMRNGSPALIYANSQFSVTIRDKNNALVIYSPVGYGIDPGSISGTVTYDDFTGDGFTIIFNLSSLPSTKNATSVYIDGVYQSKDNYSIAGSTIVFSTAPPLNSAIEVVAQESSVIGGAGSQQITYNEGGVGAVTRTVQSRLRDFVSVKDFGAVGDGVTDDASAIQSAIDSGASTIIIPEGVYRMTSGVSMAKASQSLIGFGGELAIEGTTASQVVIQNDYPYCRFENLIVRSIIPGTYNGYYGLNIRSNGDYCQIINCTFRDIRYTALFIDTSNCFVNGLVTEHCGWDSLTFYINATDNFVTNLYSYRSGRSAVGCDAGSARNVVDGGFVIDNGDPAETTQHHDVVHFEGATDSVYKNFEIYYTTNHPAAASGLTDVNAAIRFNKGGGCKAENFKVVYDTSCNGDCQLVICDQDPNDVIVNNLTVINNTSDPISTTLDYQGGVPGILMFDGLKFSGPCRIVDNGIQDVSKIFRNCYFDNVSNAAQTELFFNSARSSNYAIEGCTFDGCENVFNMKGWIDSSITDCTFSNVSGTVFQTSSFSAGNPAYDPQRGVIASNIFKGTISKCFDFYQGAAPCLVTNNYFTGTITTLVESNGATGGVGGNNSRFTQNSVTGTITTSNSELDSDANQQGVTEGSIAIRADGSALKKIVTKYVADFDDDTFKDLLTVSSGGGFATANYAGYLSGKLKVTFLGFNSIYTTVNSTRTYLFRAEQHQAGNIALTISALAAEDTDDGGVTPTITIQQKTGASATASVLEGKISFASYNTTDKPRVIVSVDYDTVTSGVPSLSLLNVN